MQSDTQGNLTGSTTLPNQAIYFEYNGDSMRKSTGHAWSASDQFRLSMNATRLNCNPGLTKFIEFRIRDVESNTVVYSGLTTSLPEYDTNYDAGDDWGAAQYFTFNFAASDFSGGVEGNTLQLEILGSDTSAGRALFVDNVQFELIPEPGAALLCVLGVLLLVLRRRRCA